MKSKVILMTPPFPSPILAGKTKLDKLFKKQRDRQKVASDR